jgi:hypothetical protein
MSKMIIFKYDIILYFIYDQIGHIVKKYYIRFVKVV